MKTPIDCFTEVSQKTFTFAKPKLTKVNDTKVDIEYEWLLVLESVEDLNDYTQTYQHAEISDGIKELMQKNYTLHNTTTWGFITELTANMKGESILQASSRLEMQVFMSRLKMINEYGRMYINPVGGGFPHTKDHIVIDEIQKKGISWPEYTRNDIKITRWPGGSHWYARIGRMDVVVDGAQKWDTWQEAKEAANKFFETEL